MGDGSDGFTWSPQSGSSTLGYVSDGQLYLVDLDTGGVTTSSAPPWGDAARILGWTG